MYKWKIIYVSFEFGMENNSKYFQFYIFFPILLFPIHSVDLGGEGKEWVQQSNVGFNCVQSHTLNSHKPF